MTTCTICGEKFGGITAFDLHRIGEFITGAVGEAAKYRRCLTPMQMREIGLKRDRHGRWCRLTPILVAKDEEEKEVA